MLAQNLTEVANRIASTEYNRFLAFSIVIWTFSDIKHSVHNNSYFINAHESKYTPEHDELFKCHCKRCKDACSNIPDFNGTSKVSDIILPMGDLVRTLQEHINDIALYINTLIEETIPQGK